MLVHQMHSSLLGNTTVGERTIRLAMRMLPICMWCFVAAYRRECYIVGIACLGSHRKAMLGNAHNRSIGSSIEQNLLRNLMTLLTSESSSLRAVQQAITATISLRQQVSDQCSCTPVVTFCGQAGR